MDLPEAHGYQRKIKKLDNFLWDNYLQDTSKKPVDDWTDLEYGIAANRYNILKEVPSTGEQINQGDPNELKYMNNLLGRVEPHLNTENVDKLTKSNAPWNLPGKYNVIKDLPIYQNDLDSIQKYLPEFYENNRLDMAKDLKLFKEGEVPEYAQGGEIMQGMPNAEVEGEETAVLPDGTDVEFKGPKHSKGGIPVNLPEGTDIFSDRLKPKGTKDTFSDINKKIVRDLKKRAKTLADPYSTPLAKRTAEKTANNLKGEQQDLFIDQERVKIQRGIKPVKASFANGGTTEGEVTDEMLKTIVNRNFDNLAKRFENVKYPNSDFTNPQAPASFDYKKELENKREETLKRLAEVNTPERRSNLYKAIYANTPSLFEQGDYIPSADYDYDNTPYNQGSPLAGQSSGYAEFGNAQQPQQPQQPSQNNPLEESRRPDIVFPEGEGNPLNPDIPTITYPIGHDDELAQEDPIAMQPWMTDLDAFNPEVQAISRDTSFEQPTGDTLADVRGGNIGVDESSYAEALQGVSGDNLAGPNVDADGFSRGSKMAGGIGAAAQLAPALYNIGQGLFGKPEQLDPQDYMNTAGMAAASRARKRRFNIDPQLAANRRNFNIGRRNTVNASRTRGELLSNLAVGTAGKAQADSAAYAQKQNIENQYGMQGDQLASQVGAQNASTAFSVQDYNARSRAAQQNLTGAGLAQLSGIAQQAGRDRGMRGADQTRLNLLSGIAPNYRYDQRTGKYIAV